MSEPTIWSKRVKCVYAAKRVGETNYFVKDEHYTIHAEISCKCKVHYKFYTAGREYRVYCAEATLASERYVICRDEDQPWLGILAEFQPI